ncbi:MAG TPA: methyltransferase domain-containing protein [Thermoanaerobaculia bacterium]|nr:methyltransferase domain-containing protein [Thermoanaerobaculia bacterium]
MSLPYREFYYPLNVFMHILTHEEGAVPYLHYGLFTHPGERIGSAQERSTQLLVARLPPPPARLLEVGSGLGTTLRLLLDLGYDATGITPDEKQIAMIGALPVRCMRFEDYPAESFDTILFQESSQYIDSNALFARAHALAPHMIVLDEFALRPIDIPGALHSFEGFLDAAAQHGFRVIEEVDLSAQAAPTVDYFNLRLDRFREPLIRDLGITNEQVDDLIASGVRYRSLYADGTYGYRLLQFKAL